MKMNSNHETKVFAIHTENDDRFGFTLAGQYPCQLVKVQEGSPAHKAGLKSGDEILEVNGVNVEDLKHDCVASFITPSANGKTELRIRRVNASPKTVKISGQSVHKSVSEDLSCSSSTAYLSNVVDRVVEEFKRPTTPGSTSVLQRKGLDSALFYGSQGKEMASDEQLRASFAPTESAVLNTAANISSHLKPSQKMRQKPDQMAEEQCKIEAVVGYLGSIDRPTARIEPELLLAHIRTRTTPPVFVLLEVSPSRLNVKNSNKQVIMTCATKSLVYVGICPDNKQILGLFTEKEPAPGKEATQVSSNVASIASDLNLDCLCHLFVIDVRLIRHLNHKRLTDRFQLLCVPDPSTGSCQQFPTSSAAILNTLSVILRGSSLIRSPNETDRKPDGIPFNTSQEAAGLKQPRHICQGASGGNDYASSLVGNSTQAEDNNGVEEQELNLCLHLYSLVHNGLSRDTDMNYFPQGNYCVDNGDYIHSSVHQTTSSSVSMSTSTTSHRSISIQKEYGSELTSTTPTSVSKESEEKSEEKKESRAGHKTLVHRRSQSLAGNLTNSIQPCMTVTQAYECHSQSDFRIGNGGRPVFHSSSSSVLACNNINDVEGKVARWALAFDKLLEDKTGVVIFRAFLQKEYSEENLIFWLACEKYKKLTNETELKKTAEEIYETHLKSCAALPVNVESSAIRSVEERLEKPRGDLFTTLQYQIYTLMKFDSYARFLKSDLYRQCWVDELEGRPIGIEDRTKKAEEGTSTLRRMFGSSTKAKGWKAIKAQSSSTSTSTSTSTSETEENKKKSFLPWRGRLKSEPKKTTNRSSDSQASSARSSLSSLSDSVFSTNITNSDEALNESDSKDQAPPTCRVILPSGLLMYLFCKNTRSLKEGLSRLCENKEYALPALDLFIGERKLTRDDLQKKLTRFINKEIILKQCVLFRLEMTNDRIVGIKAVAEKTITEVLEPILREANLDINDVVIRQRNTQELVNKDSSVLSLHQHHVIVERNSDNEMSSDLSVKENDPKVQNAIVVYNPQPCEEDKVFDALLCGKRQSITGFSFDENGIFGPLIRITSSKETLSVKEKDKQLRMARSPALFRKKKREATQSASTFKTFIVEDEKKDSEELFTLLRRSQNSRLDDQRGVLDKKVELPDFLKLPEKPPSKRNTVLDVGVPSPRPQHQPLKKSTSSSACLEPSTANQLAKKQPAVIIERPAPPERNASVQRNWTGSLRIRGRTHVETVMRVVTETQTIDRRQFSKSNSVNVTTAGTRARAESLQHERPDSREITLRNDVNRTRSRYHYESESTVVNKTDNDVVWVSSPMSTNRRRGSNRVAHCENGGNETKNNGEHSRGAEVIIPDMNYNAAQFPITGAVVPFFDRPKPITDSTFFREFLESANLNMPTPEGPPKARNFESVNEREAILDNSFLRDQLKPSRLFSQLTPEAAGTPSGSPSEGRQRGNSDSGKCPLFIPPTFRISAEDENSNASHAEPTNNARNAAENDSDRKECWGVSDLYSKEDESVRVTFV